MPKLPRSTSSATSSMASGTIPSRPAKPYPDRLKIMHLFPDRPLAHYLGSINGGASVDFEKKSLSEPRARARETSIAGEVPRDTPRTWVTKAWQAYCYACPWDEEVPMTALLKAEIDVTGAHLAVQELMRLSDGSRVHDYIADQFAA